MTNAERIERYSAGGDLYSALAAKYGIPKANYVAYQTIQHQGESDGTRAAIEYISFGPEIANDTFWEQFGDQIYHSPFQAPIEAASDILSNTGSSLDKGAEKVLTSGFSVWIILLLLALGGLIYFGGAGLLLRRIK